MRSGLSIVSIALAALMFFSSCGKDNEKQTAADNSKQENQKSATSSGNDLGDDVSISYDLSGKVTGSMTIMRNGKELKQIIDSEVMGMKSKNEIFIKGNSVFSVTEVAGKKMAMRTGIDEYNSRKPTGETIADPKEFERLLDGKTVVGNENILGYDCEIYDFGNNIKLSVADKKYIMRINAPEFKAVATKIEPLGAGSEKEFELPTDVEFKPVSPRIPNQNLKVDSLLEELKK